MLEHGTTYDSNRQTLLNQLYYYSAYIGNHYLLEKLKNEGAEIYPEYLEKGDIEIKIGEELYLINLKTALNQAAHGGHLELVKQFHQEGSPLVGSLHYALMNRETDVITYVLEQGIDLRIEIQYFPTTLYYFFRQKESTQFYIIELLIENGLLESNNQDLKHDLFIKSTESGGIAILRKFIELGMDVTLNHENPNHNLLKRSLMFNDLDFIKLIVNIGKEKIIKSPGSKGILVDTIGLNAEIFDYLYEHGADIHQTNSHDETVLHKALLENNRKIVDLCIKQKVDINAKSDDGTTPLIIAVLKGYVSMVKLLLEHGADTQIQDNQGKTALDYAREFDDQEMIELLLHAN